MSSFAPFNVGFCCQIELSYQFCKLSNLKCYMSNMVIIIYSYLFFRRYTLSSRTKLSWDVSILNVIINVPGRDDISGKYNLVTSCYSSLWHIMLNWFQYILVYCFFNCDSICNHLIFLEILELNFQSSFSYLVVGHKFQAQIQYITSF